MKNVNEKSNFNDFNDLRLFRYTLIIPAINNTHGFKSKEEYFKHISNTKQYFNGKEVSVSIPTLKRWCKRYNDESINGLARKERRDKNSCPKLRNETIDRINELREQFPYITTKKIYQILIQEEYFNNSHISLNTFYYYLKNDKFIKPTSSNAEKRRFEMKYANSCWQSDTSTGPYIILEGKKVRTYLIMFLDDKSRMIMGYDFVLNDNAINMQNTFKNAVKTFGVPKMLFVDNGKPYKNEQLSYICASLGTELIHAKPYSPESKGKIERAFLTIKNGWMNSTNWNEFNSLEDVKKSFEKYVRNTYQTSVNSSTKLPPFTSWNNDFKEIKFKTEEEIEEIFLHRVFRTVSNDQVVSINNNLYEVPNKYVKKKIECRYYPFNKDEIYIYENEKRVITCKQLNKNTNSKIKRKVSINYSKLVNDERDVIEKNAE